MKPLPYLFRSTGSVMKFQGYLALYREAREEGDGHGRPLEDEQALPSVEVGESVPVKQITPSQHFTEPPPRYSEASLVKELERLGIGRPSTYASIISTLVDRRYAQLEQRRFFPTELGDKVERVMVKSFPDIFNVQFTSSMESDLDRIEEGEVNWRGMLRRILRPILDFGAGRRFRGAHRGSSRPVRAGNGALPRLRRQARCRAVDSSGRSSPARIIPRRASTRARCGEKEKPAELDRSDLP